MNWAPLINFIVQHFVVARVWNVAIFHCWELEPQLEILKTANGRHLRAQMVDMTRDFEFPGRYFDSTSTTLGVFFDFNCEKSKAILNKSSELELFAGMYEWLILDEMSNLSRLTDQFEEAMLSVDADISYAAKDEANSSVSAVSFLLYDVYNNGKRQGGKLNITLDKRVTCEAENCSTHYLSTLHLRPKSRNRSLLSDITFRMATMITAMPLNSPKEEIVKFLMTVHEKSIDRICRMGFKLIPLLQDQMRFNINHIFMNSWSKTLADGDAFGALRHGEVDFVSTGFLPAYPRLSYATGLLKVCDFRSIFLFRTPQNEGLYGSVFFRPFSGEVWLAFMVVILVFAFLLWAIFFIEIRLVKCMQFIPSLLLTFLISFGLACTQGTSLIPRTTGGRIAFFSVAMVTFIMYNYYTSLVVSSLLGAPVKSNIKTVDQLAESSLKVGVEPVPFTQVYLNVSKLPSVVKLVKRKLNENNGEKVWIDPLEGIIKVRDGGFAYQTLASSAYDLMERYYKQEEICDLNEVKLRPESLLVFLLNRNSPYKEHFRLSLVRMKETGFISRNANYWMRTKLDCFASVIRVTVGLEYTGPLFFMLGVIYVFALAVLLVEIVYHRYTVTRRLKISFAALNLQRKTQKPKH